MAVEENHSKALSEYTIASRGAPSSNGPTKLKKHGTGGLDDLLNQKLLEE
jgi:hypothetical protein